MKSEEHKIQVSIVDYIRTVLPHAIVFAVPNGGKRGVAEATRFKREGVLAGVTDLILLLAPRRAYFIEVKVAKGKLSDEQSDFADSIIAKGFDHAIVRSVDDMRLALKAWGIVTREAKHEPSIR